MTAIEQFLAEKRSVDVLGSRMAYHESGVGLPIVLLHGNPTSSVLWRQVIPHLSALGRCIAPDLIGMGDSAKLGQDAAYRFSDHRRYLDALLDRLGVDGDVVLVLHDWGSALGFDWANRHRDRVAGIAYMEAIVAPWDSWEDWPAAARSVFKRMRSDAGEALVLEGNAFVERVLPASVLRDLDPGEMDEYRRPFPTPLDRRPTLQWPRELPIEGHPADTAAIVADYAEWLAHADVPKLFVNAEPGSVLVGAQRDLCRAWPRQTEVTVRGSHFLQEDSPHEIGAALAEWIPTVRVPTDDAAAVEAGRT